MSGDVDAEVARRLNEIEAQVARIEERHQTILDLLVARRSGEPRSN